MSTVVSYPVMNELAVGLLAFAVDVATTPIGVLTVVLFASVAIARRLP